MNEKPGDVFALFRRCDNYCVDLFMCVEPPNLFHIKGLKCHMSLILVCSLSGHWTEVFDRDGQLTVREALPFPAFPNIRVLESDEYDWIVPNESIPPRIWLWH